MKYSIIALALFAAICSAAEVKITITETGSPCDVKAKNGDKLLVHYAGRLASNDREFDSSFKRGDPFGLTLGQGMVIQGWEQGLQGMCLCERRLLEIPSELGYGARGAGGVIPPNSDLIFETQMMGINGVKCEPKNDL